MCRFVLDGYGLKFAGLDFMVEDDLWYLIDVNPTAGGRKVPAEDWEGFQQAMKRNLQAIISGKEREKKESRIQAIIYAAGKGKRLEEVTQGGPKSLLALPDQGTLLDKVMDWTTILADNSHFFSPVNILHRPEKEDFFDIWQRSSLLGERAQLITPAQEIATTYESSVNQLFTIFNTLPEQTDLILAIPGDRIIDVPPETLSQVAEDVYTALTKENYPFVVLGMPTDTSRYQYVANEKDTIIKCVQGETKGGVGIRKLGVAFNAAKMPLTHARNFQRLVSRLTEAGCYGKLILIDSPTFFDVDTPEDWEEACNYFRDK